MHKAKTDGKNIELLKLVAQLRNHIDLHRIIGLNVGALRDPIGSALLGYLQKSALESVAMYICKIFESSPRNELNSIPGIIESLPSKRLSSDQQREFTVFGKRYGNHSNPIEQSSYLKGTFGLFCGIQSEPLARLKEFRDKIGAHSDSTANIKFLRSHSEYEILFSFANDFYGLVSHSIIGFGIAPISRVVSDDFVRLIKSVGVEEIKCDFDKET